jgi:endonuclease-3 related protein
MKKREELMEIYETLRKAFGYRDWWPAETPFEVIIGAILTQNVSWSNAARAIGGLKAAGRMSPEALHASMPAAIAPLIKPSRFYNMKAIKIKNFMDFFYNEYRGDLEAMARDGLARKKLLAVKGLGQETVDCILLYACGKPVFVVDAYTKRILLRYGGLKGDPSYEDVQKYFMASLPVDVDLYNDYHAQLVHLGHTTCKSRDPCCGSCPIASNERLSCHFCKST